VLGYYYLAELCGYTILSRTGLERFHFGEYSRLAVSEMVFDVLLNIKGGYNIRSQLGRVVRNCC